MSSLETALLQLTGVPDAEITAQTLSSALATVPGGKATVESKIQKLSTALASSGGRTRKHKSRKARKTRKH